MEFSRTLNSCDAQDEMAFKSAHSKSCTKQMINAALDNCTPTTSHPANPQKINCPSSSSSSDLGIDDIQSNLDVGGSGNSNISCSSGSLENQTHSQQQLRHQRFQKTAALLKNSGLFEVTVRTARLLRANQRLQKELEQLKTETSAFLQDVLNNPENAKIVQMMDHSTHEKPPAH